MAIGAAIVIALLFLWPRVHSRSHPPKAILASLAKNGADAGSESRDGGIAAVTATDAGTLAKAATSGGGVVAQKTAPPPAVAEARDAGTADAGLARSKAAEPSVLRPDAAPAIARSDDPIVATGALPPGFPDPAVITRDPFLSPEEIRALADGAPVLVAADGGVSVALPSKPVVEEAPVEKPHHRPVETEFGFVITGKTNTAWLSGRLVNKGDRVGGDLVTGIAQDHIDLRTAEGQHRIIRFRRQSADVWSLGKKQAKKEKEP